MLPAEPCCFSSLMWLTTPAWMKTKGSVCIAGITFHVSRFTFYVFLIFLLLPHLSFAKDFKLLSVNAGDRVPLLADGTMLWGEGQLIRRDESHRWKFPFDRKMPNNTEIEAELFWDDFGADLSLGIEFRDRVAAEPADAVNTQSEVLRLPVSDCELDVLTVKLMEHVQKNKAVSYFLRCVVRRRRSVPKGGFDAKPKPLILGTPAVSNSTSSGDEHWWQIELKGHFKQIVPKNLKPFEATLFVTLEPLRDGKLLPSDYGRYDLQLYDRMTKEEMPRLRKTALVDSLHPPECFLSLENLRWIDGDSQQFLVRVSPKEGDIGQYRLRGELLYPNRTELLNPKPHGNRSVFRLKGKRPWKQRLIADERWATDTVEIPVWNPGHLIVASTFEETLSGNIKEFLKISHENSTSLPQLLEGEEFVKSEGDPGRKGLRWQLPVTSQGKVRVTFHAVDSSNPSSLVGVSSATDAGGRIQYTLETKILPDWNVVYKGDLHNKFPSRLEYFTVQQQGQSQLQGQANRWIFSAAKSGEHEVRVSSKEANGWFDIEVFQQKPLRFLARASATPETGGGEYQRSCFFTAKEDGKYIALVSLNTRLPDSVPYQIAFEPRKQVSRDPNILQEGEVKPFDQNSLYPITVHGPARVLIQLSHPNSPSQVDVEILRSNFKLDFERTDYGTHDELAISLPEAGLHALTIRPIGTPPMGTTIYYVLQRKGLGVVADTLPDFSNSNDHFGFAEWVSLPKEGGGIQLIGQVDLKNDPVDCWRLDWKGNAKKIRVRLEDGAGALHLEAYSADGKIVKDWVQMRPLQGTREFTVGESQNSVAYLMVIDTRVPSTGPSTEPPQYTISIDLNQKEIETIQMESDVDFRLNQVKRK